MKKFVSYININDLGSISERHLKLFTRINLAFGKLKDGELYINNIKSMDFIDNIRSINPDIEIILSIGGGGAFGFSDMAMEFDTRKKFIESMIAHVEKFNLDGIDLDWEFPCCDWGGDFSPKDKENFTFLLMEMRNALDLYGDRINKKMILTIAAGVGEWFINVVEIEKIHKYLDQVMLMTYDLRGFNQPITGHHTTLYTKEKDVYRMSAHDGIKLLMDKGVPKEKIVMGFATYSRYWEGVSPQNNGLLQDSKLGSGDYFLQYPEIQTQIIENPEFEVFWDDEAKVPWAYSKDGKFVTFDNYESVREKCRYIIENDLPGIMFWRYVIWEKNPLFEAVNDEFYHHQF